MRTVAIGKLVATALSLALAVGCAGPDNAAPEKAQQKAQKAPPQVSAQPTPTPPRQVRRVRKIQPDPQVVDEWKAYMQGATLSILHGYDEGAELQLLAALKLARTFGPTDRRLAETLRQLAEFYGTQGRLVLSARTYRQWVAMSDKIRASAQPDADYRVRDVALSLESYAALLRLTGHLSEAAAMQARAAELLKKASR